MLHGFIVCSEIKILAADVNQIGNSNSQESQFDISVRVKLQE